MAESLMTTAETLKYLKINKITLYHLIKTNELPALRVGRQWRFNKDRLDKWLENSSSSSHVSRRLRV